MRRVLAMIALALSLVGCVIAPSGEPTQIPPGTASPPLGTSVPSLEATPSQGVEATPVATPGAQLKVEGFARVVVPELNARVRPTTSARRVNEELGGPLQFGTNTEDGVDDVFVVDGPVKAAGYEWWLVYATEYYWNTRESGKIITRPLPFPQNYGWVASGDENRAWLVPVDPCPSGPVDISQLTTSVASWAVRLGCFKGQVLTIKGWFDGDDVLPAVFPERRGWDSGKNWDRLDYKAFPESLAFPAPKQWIELTGQFDHPSGATCPANESLACRSTFVVTEVRALGQ